MRGIELVNWIKSELIELIPLFGRVDHPVELGQVFGVRVKYVLTLRNRTIKGQLKKL